MPSADAPTIGRVISNVASALEEPAFWPERARSSLRLSLSIPPRSCSTGMRQSSSTTSAVCEARMPIFVSLLPWRRPGVPLPITKEAWPRCPSSGSTMRDHHVDVGDAAVGDEDLGAVQDPLVAVEPRGRLQALHVRARLRLGDRVGAELDLVADPEALRDPLGDLLGGAGGGEAGRGEARALDRERDPGAAPVQLLGGDDAELTVRVLPHLLHVLEALQAPLAGLPDDLPGRALLGVVLRRDGPDHLAGEPPDLLLVLPLLVVESEIHLGAPPVVVAAARRFRG